MFNNIPDLYAYDKVVISFGGALLVYDSFYNVLPKLLNKFNVGFNPFSVTDMFYRIKPE